MRHLVARARVCLRARREACMRACMLGRHHACTRMHACPRAPASCVCRCAWAQQRCLAAWAAAQLPWQCLLSLQNPSGLWLERREEQGYPLGLVSAAPAPRSLPPAPPASAEPRAFVLEVGSEELPPDDVVSGMAQLR